MTVRKLSNSGMPGEPFRNSQRQTGPRAEWCLRFTPVSTLASQGRGVTAGGGVQPGARRWGLRSEAEKQGRGTGRGLSCVFKVCSGFQGCFVFVCSHLPVSLSALEQSSTRGCLRSVWGKGRLTTRTVLSGTKHEDGPILNGTCGQPGQRGLRVGVSTELSGAGSRCGHRAEGDAGVPSGQGVQLRPGKATGDVGTNPAASHVPAPGPDAEGGGLGAGA